MKKFTALILTFMMVFANINMIAAQETETTPDYIPLKMAAENSGGTVIWDEETQLAVLSYKGAVYEFSAESGTAVKNGESYTLKAPFMIDEGVGYVEYDDVAFLFESENDPYKETKKEAVTLAYTLMDYYRIPGMTLSFIDSDSNYKWVQGFGYADVETEKVVDENTAFSLASISKTFTAVAIMQLAEEGKIDLDEKVVTYLPDFKIKAHPVYGGDYRDITIRMLLSHYSGLPGDTFAAFYTTKDYYKNYMDDFMKDLKAQYMDEQSLSRVNYANNGYVLLGILVSELMGYDSPFDGFVEYTDDNIFEILDMKLSSFYLKDAIKENLASSYYNADAEKSGDLLVNAIPAGGLYSTAGDMVNFMETILNGGLRGGYRMLKPESVETMFTLVDYDTPVLSQLNMGHGLYETKYHNVKTMGHGGDVCFFHSDLQFSKEHNLGIFVSANSATSAGISSSLSVLVMKAAVEEKTGILYAALQPVSKPAAEIPGDMADIEGYYTAVGKITANDEGLYLELLDLTLIPQEDGSYFNDLLGRVWFREMNGEFTMLLGETALTPLGMRVSVQKADSGFLNWVGRYTDATTAPNNASILVEINFAVNDEGYPVMSFVTNDGGSSGEMLLEKINDTTYYVAGKGRNYGKVIEFDNTIAIKYATIFGAQFVKN